MTTVTLSDVFYFVLEDGDTVWPSTVAGDFRLSDGGDGHNVLEERERPVSELEMTHGVLEQGKASRFRSKTSPARKKNPNHFSISSPSVVEVHVKVGTKFVRTK